METLIVSPWVLALAFFAVAFLYTSVGMGGGSSYTALLAIFGAGALAIPSISLTLNILATSIGGLAYLRAGHVRLRLITPFLLGSIPAAWLGGALVLPRNVFLGLLVISLALVVARIYLPGPTALQLQLNQRQQWLLSLCIGAVLGFLAGAVGIGGGVYLVPLILLLGMGSVKEAAAAGAVFIWVNSVIGLVARQVEGRLELSYSLPLLLAVLAGSLLGARLGARHFSASLVEKLLGTVLILAIVLLLNRLF